MYNLEWHCMCEVDKAKKKQNCPTPSCPSEPSILTKKTLNTLRRGNFMAEWIMTRIDGLDKHYKLWASYRYGSMHVLTSYHNRLSSSNKSNRLFSTAWNRLLEFVACTSVAVTSAIVLRVVSFSHWVDHSGVSPCSRHDKSRGNYTCVSKHKVCFFQLTLFLWRLLVI